MNKPIFMLARAIVPIVIALAVAEPNKATVLFAVAAVLSYGVPWGPRVAMLAKRNKLPAPVLPLLISLGLLAATVALGAMGFSEPTTARYYPFPAALIGALSLGVACLVPPSASFLPALREVYLDPSKHLGPRGPSADDSMLSQIDREKKRQMEEQNLVLTTAAVSYVASVVVDIASSLYVSMAFVVMALTSSTDEKWVWQAGGGFLLAFGAATATVSAKKGESLMVTAGGVVFLSCIAVAIAAAFGATTTALAAPMVIVSLLLAVIGPARFPRVCDLILGAGAIATGALIAAV
ncbi:MAG: hypothetical protein R3F14_47215 [Polyangiaceae bacterium]